MPASKKHIEREKIAEEKMNNKNNELLKECAEIIEVLSDEAVEDVLILARLKIAMQDDKDIFISAGDWLNTPQEIKKAVASLLEFQMRTS